MRPIRPAIMLCTLALGGKIHAQDQVDPQFCTRLGGVLEHAAVNFTPAQDTDAPRFEDVHTCTLSKAITGANTYHCAWKFPFRDPRAGDKYRTITASVRGCFNDVSDAITDTGVNHPDSYTQREFTIGQTVIRLSIKDKGALQETYVFMGVEGTVRP